MTQLAIEDGEQAPSPAWRTFRRGIALSPELKVGLAGTVALALVSMIGRAIVPFAIQQGIDRGLVGRDPPDISVVVTVVAITLALLVVTTTCGYLMIRRL